jgi:hypothetical protein
MIAIITSTIAPASKNLFFEKRSSYSVEERLKQTLITVESLQKHGVNEIYLFDNSSIEDFEKFKQYFENISIFNIPQYQFNNKSINEHLLILTGLIHLPDNQPIVKISGRYKLNDKFTFRDLEKYDFILKTSEFEKSNGTISTRCLMVKNKKILEDVLTTSLFELFGYNLRVVGIRSGINFLKSFLSPKLNTEPTIAIELSMAKAIKYKKYHYQLVDLIGVEGLAAGSTDFVYE